MINLCLPARQCENTTFMSCMNLKVMDKVKSLNWKQKWFCAFEQNHLFPIKPRLFPKSINIITPHTLWSWYCFVFKALCRVISTAFKILIRRGFPSKTKIHAKRYQRSVIHSLSSITAQPDLYKANIIDYDSCCKDTQHLHVHVHEKTWPSAQVYRLLSIFKHAVHWTCEWKISKFLCPIDTHTLIQDAFIQ